MVFLFKKCFSTLACHTSCCMIWLLPALSAYLSPFSFPLAPAPTPSHITFLVCFGSLNISCFFMCHAFVHVSPPVRIALPTLSFCQTPVLPLWVGPSVTSSVRPFAFSHVDSRVLPSMSPGPVCILNLSTELELPASLRTPGHWQWPLCLFPRATTMTEQTGLHPHGAGFLIWIISVPHSPVMGHNYLLNWWMNKRNTENTQHQRQSNKDQIYLPVWYKKNNKVK